MAQRRPGGPTPRLALLVAAMLVAITMAGYFAATDGQARDLRQADAGVQTHLSGADPAAG